MIGAKELHLQAEEWRTGVRTDFDFLPNLSAFLRGGRRGGAWKLEVASKKRADISAYGLDVRGNNVVLRDESEEFKNHFGDHYGMEILDTLEYACRADSVSSGSGPVLGDPWLESLCLRDSIQIESRPEYRSIGQRHVLHAMEDMVGGDVLLGLLPTGEGKSLCINRLASLGSGMTIVVVPTIALALDQEAELRRVVPGLPQIEFAYRSNSSVELLKRIDSGEQSVLFTSPEALFGKLKGPILRAARGGRVSAFVIDEAHMLDAWGIGFRIEFQLLAGFRRRLVQEAKSANCVRPVTVLLTATLTQEGLNRIRSRFAPEEDRQFSVAGSLRLRQEAQCVFVETNEDDRLRSFEFLMRRLPRPLYVFATKRMATEEWFNAIREMGGRRVGICHGGTPSSERKRLLDGLRARPPRFEVVVGNSAFGLGVNVPNVRSVLHLCLPESLDRYYQEIGRAGRDRRAVAAITLTTAEDTRAAMAIGQKQLIGNERGHERWVRMSEKWKSEGRNQLVPIGEQVQSNERNKEWDEKTLVLLQLARLIEIKDIAWREGKKVATIEVLDSQLGKLVEWNAKVDPIREQIKREDQEAIDAMLRVVRDPENLSDELAKMYSLDLLHTHVRPSAAGESVLWPARAKDRTRVHTGLKVYLGFESLTKEEWHRIVQRLVSQGYVDWRSGDDGSSLPWSSFRLLPAKHRLSLRTMDFRDAPKRHWVDVQRSAMFDVDSALINSRSVSGVVFLPANARSSHPERRLESELGDQLKSIREILQ